MTTDTPTHRTLADHWASVPRYPLGSSPDKHAAASAPADSYAGTAYRHLTDAICYNPAEAVRQIDAAIAALSAARALITAEVTA